MKDQEYFWLAVNGASCAACDFPSATIAAKPIPEFFIGYFTRKEQLEKQDFILKAPLNQVRKYIESLPSKAKKGKLKIIKNKNPGKPEALTKWVLKGDPSILDLI